MREIPMDPMAMWSHATTTRPFTPIEALMSSTGGEAVETSVMELIALRELINDAIDDELTDLELWVFNALFVERKSLRRLGRELSIPKTTIARIRDKAIEKLRTALQDHPTIKEYLER